MVLTFTHLQRTNPPLGGQGGKRGQAEENKNTLKNQTKLSYENFTDRVKKLREQSLNAVEKISAERALLITRFYKSDEARELSAPVKRAKAFEYLLKNKKICINEGELIVGREDLLQRKRLLIRK